MKKPAARIQKPMALVLGAFIVLPNVTSSAALATPASHADLLGQLSRSTNPVKTTNVGEHLTATWDSIAETLTVTGHGELNRDLWMEQRQSNAAWTKKLIFQPTAGKKIILPANSSHLFSEFTRATFVWPADGIDTSRVTTMSFMFADSRRANPDVSKWDTSQVVDMSHLFEKAAEATPQVTSWNTSRVTNMSHMFSETRKATPDTANWDTSNVVDMSNMFFGAWDANPATATWNTSKVTNMSGMFRATTLANPDTTNWDTSNVTDMSDMFLASDAANPNTATWNTHNVTTMSRMFESTKVANPDTSNWDTSRVTDMRSMFRRADVANPDVSRWNTAQVRDMSAMFNNTDMANPNTSNWNTANVTDMNSMFARAKSAQPNTANWDTSKVTDMHSMFYQAERANPDTARWDTGNVTDMGNMFEEASSANPDVTNWNTAQVTNMRSMFNEARNATPNTSRWNTSRVTDMHQMFYKATLANPDTANWDTSQVTDMNGMFYFAKNANPDVTNWNTAKVKDMYELFRGAISANPDVSKWDTSSLTNASFMFKGAHATKLIDMTHWSRVPAAGVDYHLDSFSTEGSTSLRLTGAQLKAIFADFEGWPFAKIPYNIVEDNPAQTQDPGQAQPQAQGQAPVLAKTIIPEELQVNNFGDQHDKLDAYIAKSVKDDKIYLLRPNPTINVSAQDATIQEGDPAPHLTFEALMHGKVIDITQQTAGELSCGYTQADQLQGATQKQYDISRGTLNLKDEYKYGYDVIFNPGVLTVTAKNQTPPAPTPPQPTPLNMVPELEVKNAEITVGQTLDLRSLIVKASDVEDGDNLKAQVSILPGTYTNQTPGVYQVQFTLTDKGGASVTQTATVTVKQVQPTPTPPMPLNMVPTLEVKNAEITVGEQLDLRSLITKAEDAEDGKNLQDQVKIQQGAYTNQTPGVYKVQFTLTDKDGASVTQTATVTVKQVSPEPMPPQPTPPQPTPPQPTPPQPTPPAPTPSPSPTPDPKPTPESKPVIKPKPATSAPSPKSASIPKTGEAHTFVALLSVLGSTIAGIALVAKKKMKKDK